MTQIEVLFVTVPYAKM